MTRACKHLQIQPGGEPVCGVYGHERRKLLEALARQRFPDTSIDTGACPVADSAQWEACPCYVPREESD